MGGGPDWHEKNVTEPPFRVDNVGNFSAYEIKVQAFNEIGRGPEPDPVIGYSGEDGTIFFKKLLLFQQHTFLSSTWHSNPSPSCLSLALSSFRGPDGCGC